MIRPLAPCDHDKCGPTACRQSADPKGAAVSARVERLEMHHEQPIVSHPDLPGLPVPAFGETGTPPLGIGFAPTPAPTE